jgi:RNA polymerase-binding transcription factor DksA
VTTTCLSRSSIAPGRYGICSRSQSIISAARRSSVFAVTLAGAAVAAAALGSLPRCPGRLPALQGAV